jgi:hypothetical protein
LLTGAGHSLSYTIFFAVHRRKGFYFRSEEREPPKTPKERKKRGATMIKMIKKRVNTCMGYFAAYFVTPPAAKLPAVSNELPANGTQIGKKKI